MPPRLRVKGPKKATSKVSYSTEIQIHDGKLRQKLHVRIRLPPERLAQITSNIGRENDGRDQKLESESWQNASQAGDDLTDSDLSSLDLELNKALLSSTTAICSEKTSSYTKTQPIKKEPLENSLFLETSPKNHTLKKADSTIDELVGFRLIPRNLTSMLRRELGDIDDVDDEIESIQKMIFSLKDPLSAGKIKLPVKSLLCQHFECFDFDNFCLFNRIPPGVKTLIKKDLAKRNLELRRTEKYRQQKEPIKNENNSGRYATAPNMGQLTLQTATYKQTKRFQAHFAPPKIPTYQCPVCNITFELNQLYISDIFNFFVKTTPKEIQRIELRGFEHYKIIDYSNHRPSPSPLKLKEIQEIVILSDESEDESSHLTFNKSNLSNIQTHRSDPIKYSPTLSLNYFANETSASQDHHHPLESTKSPALWGSNDEVFNDGLDDELIKLSNTDESNVYIGKGSWEDPVTLD